MTRRGYYRSMLADGGGLHIGRAMGSSIQRTENIMLGAVACIRTGSVLTWLLGQGWLGTSWKKIRESCPELGGVPVALVKHRSIVCRRCVGRGLQRKKERRNVTDCLTKLAPYQRLPERGGRNNWLRKIEVRTVAPGAAKLER
jgi:hypothetical protein